MYHWLWYIYMYVCIEYSNMQIIEHNLWYHPYMLPYRTAIFREFMNTKSHKSTSPPVSLRTQRITSPPLHLLVYEHKGSQVQLSTC